MLRLEARRTEFSAARAELDAGTHWEEPLEEFNKRVQREKRNAARRINRHIEKIKTERAQTKEEAKNSEIFWLQME
jgi:hypothetical protein